MTKQHILGAYRLIFMTLGLAGLGMNLYLGMQDGDFNAGNFFSFFTIQANLLAAFTFLVTGVAALRSTGQGRFAMLRGFATLAMTITGIIYFLLLRGLEESLQIPVPWVNTVLHYVIPLAILGDWVIDPPPRTISFRGSLSWVLFPAAYVFYSLIRGAFVDWYPYPFLNARVQSYGNIAMTCAVMLVATTTLAALLAARTRVGQRR